MPSLQHIIKQNVEVGTKLENLVVVITGGTSGIGENTAYKFAKYSKSPTIYIIGRNKEKGAKVLINLKEINDDNAKYYFLSYDLSLISEADKVINYIKAKTAKVNVIILSSGFLEIGKRKASIEGIDKRLAVNYYSRWRIVDGLIDLVQKAAESKELSRVVSVLHPGIEGFVHPEDIGLRKNAGIIDYNLHASTLNSTAVLRFSKEYPSISFTHVYPGVVQTNVLKNLPWYIRYPISGIMLILGTTAEDSGERIFYISGSSQEFAKGGDLVNGDCDSILEYSKNRGGWWREESIKKVWKHTLEEFDGAINNPYP